MSDAQRLLLLNIANMQTQPGAIAKVSDDLFFQMPDNNDDVLDANALHVLQLILDDRFVTDGKQWLGHV